MIHLLNLVGGMTTLQRLFPPRVAGWIAFHAAYVDVRLGLYRDGRGS